MAERPLPGDRDAQESVLASLGVGANDPQPEEEYAVLGERIGALIEGLEGHADPEVGDKLDELLIAFDRVHRDALGRLAGLLDHHELLEHALTDPVIAMVLDLYELHPADPGELASASTAADAPASPPKPTAPLIRLQDIRHFPAATMPPSAAPPAAGPRALEEAVASASAQPAPPTEVRASLPPVVPQSALPRRDPPPTDETGTVVPTAGPAEWTTVFAVEHAPDGEPVASADGEVLICNVNGVMHALRNRCGGTPLPLHFGQLVDGHLVCPWHKVCDYDLLTGESSSGRCTVVYPLRVEGRAIEVALNQGRSTGPLQPTRLRAEPM